MNTIQRITQLEVNQTNKELMLTIRELKARILKLEDIHEDEGYITRRPRKALRI
jgi:hypothetical protein